MLLEVSNIIYERHADGRPPDRAYWVGRKLKKCIFGVVKACTILKFHNVPDVPWEVTDGTPGRRQNHVVARDSRELRHIEERRKEVTAMKFVYREGVHPHIMGTLDVLQDDEYLLLMLMPVLFLGGFVWVCSISRTLS